MITIRLQKNMAINMLLRKVLRLFSAQLLVLIFPELAAKW